MKGVDGGVADFAGGDAIWGYGGLEFAGFPGGQDATGNARFGAKIREIGYVVFVIPWDGHKQAAGVLDDVGGEFLKQSALFAAFLCRLGIGTHISATTVQQPVVAAGCAHRDVTFFHQQAFHPPQGQVPGQTGSGGSSADYQNASFELHEILNNISSKIPFLKMKRNSPFHL